MKAIKALVAFMGVLLLAGLGLLGYGVATRTAPDPGAAPPTVPASAGPVIGKDFGAVTVPLPAGVRIEQTLVVGERLVVRVTGAGPEQLVVLDPMGGRIIGSFVLQPEPAKGR